MENAEPLRLRVLNVEQMRAEILAYVVAAFPGKDEITMAEVAALVEDTLKASAMVYFVILRNTYWRGVQLGVISGMLVSALIMAGAMWWWR